MDASVHRRGCWVPLAAGVAVLVAGCGGGAGPASTSADGPESAPPRTAIETVARPMSPGTTARADGVEVALVGGIVLAGSGSQDQPEGVARYCVRLLASLPPSCPAAPFGVELAGLDAIEVPWAGEQGRWRWADYVVIEGRLRGAVLEVSRVAPVIAPAGGSDALSVSLR